MGGAGKLDQEDTGPKLKAAKLEMPASKPKEGPTKKDGTTNPWRWIWVVVLVDGIILLVIAGLLWHCMANKEKEKTRPKKMRAVAATVHTLPSEGPPALEQAAEAAPMSVVTGPSVEQRPLNMYHLMPMTNTAPHPLNTGVANTGPAVPAVIAPSYTS